MHEKTRVCVWLDDDDYAFVEAEAERQGLKPAQVVRTIVRQRAARSELARPRDE